MFAKPAFGLAFISACCIFPQHVSGAFNSFQVCCETAHVACISTRNDGSKAKKMMRIFKYEKVAYMTKSECGT